MKIKNNVPREQTSVRWVWALLCPDGSYEYHTYDIHDSLETALEAGERRRAWCVETGTRWERVLIKVHTKTTSVPTIESVTP